MVSNVLETDVEAVLDAAFGGTDEKLLVVDPSASTIVSLVEAGIARDDVPRMSMLVDERVLKDVMGDFLVASKTADLVTDGSLELRFLPEDVANALFVSASKVVALVSAGDRVAALSTTDGAFVSEVFGTYRDALADAEEYGLRTPSISRVRETMAAEIGEDAREDFDAMLASLDAARGDGGGLDEVTVSLLIAARNDVLLYDISKCGEDVGIASKATFSRTKTRLEDLGLIDTEKVPIDVGRPRLRLKLGDDRLVGLDADEFADVAVDLIG